MKTFLTFVFLSFPMILLASNEVTTYDQKSRTVMHAQGIGNDGRLVCGDQAGNRHEFQLIIKTKGFNDKTPDLSVISDGQAYPIQNIDLSFLSTMKTRKYNVKILVQKDVVLLYCNNERINQS